MSSRKSLSSPQLQALYLQILEEMLQSVSARKTSTAQLTKILGPSQFTSAPAPEDPSGSRTFTMYADDEQPIRYLDVEYKGNRAHFIDNVKLQKEIDEPQNCIRRSRL